MTLDPFVSIPVRRFSEKVFNSRLGSSDLPTDLGNGDRTPEGVGDSPSEFDEMRSAGGTYQLTECELVGIRAELDDQFRMSSNVATP